MPRLEFRMDVVGAVMDAASSERAALFGYSEGGPMCALFAATYPARTTALIMGGSYPRRMWAPDFTWGTPQDTWERFLDDVVRHWGGTVGLDVRAPSLATDPTGSPPVPARPERAGSLIADIDIRHLLPAIRLPPLI